MSSHKVNLIKLVLITALALVAFAANSILCRLALGANNIDPASFTVIRLLAGTFILMLIVSVKYYGKYSSKGSWSSGFMLFIYAVCFSFAYVTLDTATGALILFATVQITMILFSLFSGNRLLLSEWCGVLLAFIGFVYLFLPEIRTPSVIGFLLMSISGVAWGIYSINGKKSQFPLADTAYNFFRTIPLVIILSFLFFNQAQLSINGVIYAVLSGAIASGVGYAIWYTALIALTTTQAAVVQLFVPVIAALGGVVFVDEDITLHLLTSSTMILGGILTVVFGRYFFIKNKIR
ncbi:DMT family transporter [Aliikangiella sp. IMCC44359]|uniref:DMT family transporter n=1 Tax=Aliikangiella sp. IMCC44359 TaxID=3459125 RepID=UPI00403B2458